jgi:hypothetical protein
MTARSNVFDRQQCLPPDISLMRWYHGDERQLSNNLSIPTFRDN